MLNIFADGKGMKKIISVIAAATIGLCALFSGCSCTGDQTLAFNIDAAKSETLTYSVKFVEEYLGNATKNKNLDDCFTYKYDEANGKLVTSLARQYELVGVSSDIINDANVNKTVYSFTTEFEIPLTVTVGNSVYNHLEKIKTTALIADKGVSLAPIYAKEETEYLDVSASANKTTVKILKSETETFYTTENVTTKAKYKLFDADTAASEITLAGVTATEFTRKYDFRTVIDNAELLFALRAIPLEESASQTVQVISPSYNEATPIKVSNTAIATGEFTINGKNENLSYNTLCFFVNSTNASGVAQYLKVQSAPAAGSNPLLLEYAKPLVCSLDGSYVSMGWLVFTLSNAE